MLFVFAAETTIVRATTVGLDAKLFWYFSRQAIICAVEPTCITADKIFAISMLRTIFTKVDSIFA